MAGDLEPNVLKSIERLVTIVLTDANGDGVVGLAFSDLTVYLLKDGSTFAQKTMSSGDLVDLYDGSHAETRGYYHLRIKDTDASIAGWLDVAVSAAGVDGIRRFQFDVRRAPLAVSSDITDAAGNILDATDAIQTTLGSPAGASMSADIAVVKALAVITQGILGGQAVKDNYTRDINGVVTGFRLRIFGSKADADSAYVGGSPSPLATFTYQASTTSGHLTKEEGSF